MIRFHFLLAVLALSFLPSLTSTAQTPKMGGTLIIGTAKDPQGIDMYSSLAVGTEGVAVLHQIYGGLLNIDDEGNVVPGLGELMPNQPDLTTYILTPRKGIKFHNGADFDARDVTFSFDRMMNKNISRFWKTYQTLIRSKERIP